MKIRLAVFACVALLGGCAAHTARPLATPEWEGGQAKCKVAVSRSEPLVVEWPSADRAKLEALTKQGIVAVKYNGCEMQVMGTCNAQGKYRYVGTTLKRDAVRIKDADELYSKLPFGAAGLESTLKQSGQLDVTMSLVGRYATDRPVIHESELAGACAGATHVISALTVGAFEFSARAARVAHDRASVFDGSSAESTEAQKQVLTRDGDEATCAAAADGDAAPPAGCRALIRVEVISLPEAEKRALDAEERLRHQREEEQAARTRRRTAGWVVSGGGAAAGVLAGVLALRSSQEMSSIENGGLASSAEIESTEGRARDLAIGAWVSAGIAVVALGVGGGLVVTSREPNPSITAGAHGLGLVW